MPAMKELSAKWLVNAAQYINDNPQITVNGFLHSEITGALDEQETHTVDESRDDQELDSYECIYDSDDSEEDH